MIKAAVIKAFQKTLHAHNSPFSSKQPQDTPHTKKKQQAFQFHGQQSFSSSPLLKSRPPHTPPVDITSKNTQEAVLNLPSTFPLLLLCVCLEHASLHTHTLTHTRTPFTFIRISNGPCIILHPSDTHTLIHTLHTHTRTRTDKRQTQK